MSGERACPCGFNDPQGQPNQAWRHKQQHLATFPDVDARTVEALNQAIKWEDSHQ